MEARMTLCNMSIEAGARAGMVAPDQVTVDYLRGREKLPSGAAFDALAAHWLTLRSDADAVFDKVIHIDASEIAPTLTYGTNPGQVTGVDAAIPIIGGQDEQKALDYMRLQAGAALAGEKVDVVFIGSCTNSRISDLRAAAEILRGRKIAKHVRMLVVPGSEQVKKAAEAEGLDQIFIGSGAQWREAGCSMCIAMNGDHVQAGQLAVSTSNRNFEGRQGKGARTLLASPETAAASAVAGVVADPRVYLAIG
jgi:3-isopropylmalate/(R)-2-methylmalate dehydratase large subunit